MSTAAPIWWLEWPGRAALGLLPPREMRCWDSQERKLELNWGSWPAARTSSSHFMK